jgi:hypothetical protein
MERDCSKRQRGSKNPKPDGHDVSCIADHEPRL